MHIEEVINRIVTLNEGLRQFWTKADGWAPIEAAQLLSKSRLDWQVSLSRSLKIWLAETDQTNNDGHLILAWTNLGSLVEGSMKLFLSVYYMDYRKDIVAIKKDGDLIEPDTLKLEQMRIFFKKSVWVNGVEEWDDWILKIQQRRNAVHAYKNRDIGTFNEFYDDVRKYLEFLQNINDRLPYPDEMYQPNEF